jgi:hypothetical protein
MVFASEATSKKNVSEAENARHKQILTALTRDPGNKTCVDCGSTNPTWYGRLLTLLQ